MSHFPVTCTKASLNIDTEGRVVKGCVEPTQCVELFIQGKKYLEMK